MGDTNVTSNLFYDLVSIQYHALKGQEVYGKFIKDAQGQQEIVRFFERVREEDIRRAEECHRLLSQLSGTGTGTGTTGRTGTTEPYPAEDAQATGRTTGRQTTGAGNRR